MGCGNPEPLARGAEAEAIGSVRRNRGERTHTVVHAPRTEGFVSPALSYDPFRKDGNIYERGGEAPQLRRAVVSSVPSPKGTHPPFLQAVREDVDHLVKKTSGQLPASGVTLCS